MTTDVNEWLFRSPEVELTLQGHRVIVLRSTAPPLVVPIVDCYGEIPEQIFKDYMQKPGIDRMRMLKSVSTFSQVIEQLSNEILFMFFRYHDRTFCGLLGWKTASSNDFTAWQAPILLLPDGNSLVPSGLVYAAY